MAYDLASILATYQASLRSPAQLAQKAAPAAIAAAAQTSIPASLTPGVTLEQARHFPQAIYDSGKYANGVQQLIVVPADKDMLALPRPLTKRQILIILNPSLANLYFALDQAASVNAFPIPPGGSLFMDAVVLQNDIHLYSVAGTAAPLIFANLDVTQP